MKQNNCKCSFLYCLVYGFIGAALFIGLFYTIDNSIKAYKNRIVLAIKVGDVLKTKLANESGGIFTYYYISANYYNIKASDIDVYGNCYVTIQGQEAFVTDTRIWHIDGSLASYHLGQDTKIIGHLDE